MLPAEYIITNYNLVTGEENSNKVTVKSLLVDNSDLVKYYLNESKYTLKVIGKDGKVAAGQEVSFNINGVFYHRVSDENGIVSLSIKLRPGDYIVTAEYEGCRVSNNVKVLPTLVTKDLVMKYMDGSSFTAQTLDGQGKVLANQKISFNIKLNRSINQRITITVQKQSRILSCISKHFNNITTNNRRFNCYITFNRDIVVI